MTMQLSQLANPSLSPADNLTNTTLIGRDLRSVRTEPAVRPPLGGEQGGVASGRGCRCW